MDDNKLQKVGVFFGGLSEEREPSLASGRYVYSLLDPSKYEGVAIYWAKSGEFWKIPDKLVIMNTCEDIEANLKESGEKVEFENLSGLMDVAFLALHGKYGEDGCVQGLLELLKIPYTGSGVLTSALTMDRQYMKKVLDEAGVGTVDCRFIKKAEWEAESKKLLEEIEKKYGFPCVVKPTREGSSIGVDVVQKKEELKSAIDEAFKYDWTIVVEEFLDGIEFVCTVWGNDDVDSMPPTEIEFPKDQDMHTYESKYMPGKTNYYTPPRVDEKLVKKIQETAIAAYKALGMVDYARIDGFLVGEDVHIIDPHTSSFLTPSSFVFHQAAQTKVPMKFGGQGGPGKKFDPKKFKVDESLPKVQVTPQVFVSQLIELAVENHQRKKGNLAFEFRNS